VLRGKKSTLWTPGVAAGAVALVAQVVAAAEGITPCRDLGPEPVAGPTRTVSRILDAETVVLDDGRELRLIGALAPRAIDADSDAGVWPGEAAATAALRALVLGKSVELRFSGNGARADRHGRVQAQAFLIEGDGRRWVQGVLLQQGVARAYAIVGDRSCSADLLAAERVAREAGLGLWADAAYQVRSADTPSELLRFRATFQIVEGVVVRVGQTRGSLYLNFDRNWRKGFSVSLRRDDASLLGDAHAGNPKVLEGRRVRVRGWIEQRGAAPVIDVSAGGLVEVLETATSSDRQR
jgi:micrococcal nuclease